MDPLNYGHLYYFWAVAREGHLTRAADALNVSQSAVSVQIKRLEDALGQRLFERVGRRIALTGAGRRALDHADAIFGMGQRLQRAMSGGTSAGRAVLRVGAVSTLSRNFQIAFLGPALGRDDATVSIRTGALRTLARMLERHQIDLLLTNSLPPRDETAPWIAELVATEPVVLVGRRDRVARHRTWQEMLAREPLVAPTADSAVRAGFDLLTSRLGIAPTFAAEVDDMAMLRLLARADAGLGVMPAIVVRDELATGVLVEAARLPELDERFYALHLPREFPHALIAPLIAASRDRAAASSSTPARSTSATRPRAAASAPPRRDRRPARK
ncbi:MAG: LysR family transcriptional regulator [Vicinamibacterales bacterium]